MLSIIHRFSSRFYGLRKYRKEISEKVWEESIQEKPECPTKPSPENTSIP